MAIIISDNISLNSKQYLDERIGKAETLADLVSWDLDEINIPDGFEVWVASVREWYTFDRKNSISNLTGKFRTRSQYYKQNFANSRDEIATKKYWGFDENTSEDEIKNILTKGKTVTVIDPTYGTNIYVLENEDAPFNVNSWSPISFNDEDSLKIYTQSIYDNLVEKPNNWIEVPENEIKGNITNNVITTTNNGSIVNVLFSALRSLQSEVAKLRNSFKYGICSYSGTTTSLSVGMGNEEDLKDEPLWAIDEDGLSMVNDATLTISENVELYPKNNGNITYDSESKSVIIGTDGASLNTYGSINDINSDNPFYLAFKEITDSKIFLYITTTSPLVKIVLLEEITGSDTFDDISQKPIIIDIQDILGDIAWLTQYNILVCVSRTDSDNNGFNFIWVSISDATTNKTIVEGYYKNNNLTTILRKFDKRYTFYNVILNQNSSNNMQIKKLNAYSKYQDFSQNVISSQPSDEEYKYKVAHITIRAVENYSQLDNIKNQILSNELIFDESTNKLWIKNSKNKLIPLSGNITNDTGMTEQEVIEKLKEIGIVRTENNELELYDVSNITFINSETGKKFDFSINGEGNVNILEQPQQTLSERIDTINSKTSSNGNIQIKEDIDYGIRGFVSRLNIAENNITNNSTSPLSINNTSDIGLLSDRVKIGAFYAPLGTQDVFGCSHAFVELENTSDKDFQLDGCYLHFKHKIKNSSGIDEISIEHLKLDGKIPSGGTYLIRGKEYPNKNRFITIKTFDKEWYVNKQLLDFSFNTTSDEGGFALTYGLSNLSKDTQLVDSNNGGFHPYYIDSIGLNTDKIWSRYLSGQSVNNRSITLVQNAIIKNTFELDPAKQAFQSLNSYDSSRLRNSTASDTQFLKLDKEYITFPHSPNFKYSVKNFAPKASFESKNVCTDKTKMDLNKPNAVTCAFGIDASKTRCFNWVSSGLYDEYIWIRKQGSNDEWKRFESYTNVKGDVVEKDGISRKEWDENILNTIYKRITGIFPADGTFYTSHKIILNLPTATSKIVEYEYVVGRSDNNGNPDTEHISDVKYFNIYPTSWTPKLYQTTDQQGFHWIEYQVWSASAIMVNDKINNDVYKKVTNPTASNISNYWEKDENGLFHYTKDKAIVDSKSYFTHNEIIPVLTNTGDMTQNGTRINEWLDYFNAAEPLINHLEHMCVVGNNDLCGTNYEELGTGDDNGKSNSYYFHIFYCYDTFILEKEKNTNETLADFEPNKVNNKITNIAPIVNEKYIPSLYYFEFENFAFVMLNSEITWENCNSWFKTIKGNNVYNIYTGFSVPKIKNSDYKQNYINETEGNNFTTIYTMVSAIFETLKAKKTIVMCHEMPFTVITRLCLQNTQQDRYRSFSDKASPALIGSHMNQISTLDDGKGIYWFSRLCEGYNIHLVIGGHKHTFTCTWPVAENFIVPTNGKNAAGNKFLTLFNDNVTWSNDGKNLTKFPKCYCPKGLNNSGNFISPITRDVDSINNKVVYFMCQATGYKLKSNKELPGTGQLFSRVLPKSIEKDDNSSSASQEQQYPMFAIFDFSNQTTANVYLIRIKGIMSKGKFDQQTYEKTDMILEYATNSYSSLTTEDSIKNHTNNNENPFVESNQWTTQTNVLLNVIL